MKLFPALLIFFAANIAAHAEWKITSSTRENSPNEPVEHWQTVVEDSPNDARAELHFALFATHSATLRVLDQPNESHDELAATMAQTHALAGVNGGYFDPQDAPVGLLVSDGREVSPLSTASLLSGVLWTTAARVEITRAKHFKLTRAIENAVQCGPLLLERGKAVSGLNDTRSARRTFAAVDGRGHAALGFSSSVSLGQIAEILSLTNIAGRRSFVRALNLDGGSSSGFWCAGFSIPEEKSVRDFLAVFPGSIR